MNAPCTDGDKDDWQKAVVALSRAAGGYSALMVEAGGNRAEAASLLWKRSRHDEALREDLVKAACALLALAPPVARHEGARRRLWAGGAGQGACRSAILTRRLRPS